MRFNPNPPTVVQVEKSLSRWMADTLRIFLGQSHSRGQSLVELALVLPVLALMLAGIVDMGRGFQTYLIITNAAREGARYGSFHPNDPGIQTRVQNEVAGTNITITNINITYPNGDSPGNPIRVEVECQFATTLGSILGQPTLTIKNAAEMIIF